MSHKQERSELHTEISVLRTDTYGMYIRSLERITYSVLIPPYTAAGIDVLCFVFCVLSRHLHQECRRIDICTLQTSVSDE